MTLRHLICLAATAAIVGSPAISQDWQLVWSDEFDVDGLVDETKWSYQVGGGGWGNQELQYYTEARSENVRVDGGHLVIEAIHEEFGGNDYTSGRIRTLGQGDWLYGRLEVRAQLPAGLGTWPAIWMLASDSDYGNGGWPDTGEIDIMEAVGHDPGHTHSAIHTDALNHTLGTNPSATMDVPTSAIEFHVYALEWTPTRITTFVDGEQNLVFNRNGASWERWPFDRPFHLILNLAVGGTWGGAQGVEPGDFPTQLRVDYVRVYEDASGPPAVSFTGVDGPIQLDPGGDFTIEAVAEDPASEIASLTIFQGDAVLGFSSGSSTSILVEDVHTGCYAVKAVAVDAEGWTGTTDVIPVTVGEACGQAPYLMRAHRIPGRIEAEYYDLGGAGVAFSDISGSNTGSGIRLDEAVDIGPSLDVGGGYRIQDVTRREWVEYTAHVDQGGLYRFAGRVASTTDGSFSVSINGEELPEKFIYASTSSESFYRRATLDGVWLEPGPAVIRLSFDGAGTLLNWIEFDLVSGTAVEPSAEQPAGIGISAVYPQPFYDELTIEWAGTSAPRLDITLHDILGRIVWSDRLDAHTGRVGSVRFNPGALPAGVYVLGIGDGRRSDHRLVTKLDQQTHH